MQCEEEPSMLHGVDLGKWMRHSKTEKTTSVYIQVFSKNKKRKSVISNVEYFFQIFIYYTEMLHGKSFQGK